MTPHKSLGQEVKNSTANWGEEEEGCRSRRLQWRGLEQSQHCVLNTSVVTKSTSVISGQNLTSHKAHPTAQWPFPSIRSTGLFLIQEKCSHKPCSNHSFLRSPVHVLFYSKRVLESIKRQILLLQKDGLFVPSRTKDSLEEPTSWLIGSNGQVVSASQISSFA